LPVTAHRHVAGQPRQRSGVQCHVCLILYIDKLHYLSSAEHPRASKVPVKQQGLKVAIVFEGRDGAGRGGTIKAISERVSPRVFRGVALPSPTEREKSQMYLQRYMRHFPASGEIAIFDRSWYNRAGVERVTGFCTEKQAEKFLAAVPLVERAMVDSGIILWK
jgi:polyphosphate kinase